jgi:hypothetical protein
MRKLFCRLWSFYLGKELGQICTPEASLVQTPTAHIAPRPAQRAPPSRHLRRHHQLPPPPRRATTAPWPPLW